MAYIVYHKTSTQMLKMFNQESAAKRSTTCMNRNAGRESYAYADDQDYYNNVVTKKTVKNLMTGKDIVIDSNTPRCCDPSSELYWTM
jgi:hypothetical protein